MILSGLQSAYGTWQKLSNPLASLFLLLMRINWGWQFMVAGWGKLANPDRAIGFFANIGIPFPSFNVYLVGTVETLGGLLLALGLGSRLASIPLIITMLVASLTAHREACFAFFRDPDLFVSETPFAFLVTVLIVLFFGPGSLSLDYLIARWRTGRVREN